MTGRTIVVTYLFPQLERGGPLHGILALLKNLDRNRFLPSFVALSRPLHPAASADLEALECPQVQLDQRGTLDARVVPALMRHLEARGTDILHTTLLRPDWYGAIVRTMRPRLRLMTTIRGVDDVAIRMTHGPLAARVFVAANRLALARMDAVVPHSNGLAEYVRRMGVPEARVRMIPNGVDLEPFEALDRSAARRALRDELRWPADATVVGFVGTFWPYKDHEGFVRAARILHAEQPDLRFVAIGEGPRLDAMRDLVRTEGLDGVVALPGHRSDVARFHAAIDLHLFLSFSEGLPRAVLESMAAGVPVVATAVTGVVDVVTDGETGLLVPPGDAAAAAAATARLLRDPPLRARLAGAAGRRVRGTYSAVAMTRAYEALYADLANGRSPGVTSPSDRARDPR